jgi:hypothetical protein
MSDLPILIENFNILTNASMNANAYSPVQNIAEFRNYAVQCSWSGTSPVGNLDIMVSNDKCNYVSCGTLPVSGNLGTDIFNVCDAAYQYMFVAYTVTSGTGTLNVMISAKRS